MGGIEPVQPQAGASHLVEYGRFQMRVTVVAGLVPAMIVAHAKDDIRSRFSGSAGCEIARRENADAIVVGKRGLGQLSGLLLGSVSQKVVSVAPVTVMVVP